MQGPIIDQLVEELKGNDKIKIAKLNVDENQGKAQEWEVMSIPTLKIFKDGKPVENFVGLQSKESLVEKINSHLS
jgi:thioredoxin 1